MSRRQTIHFRPWNALALMRPVAHPTSPRGGYPEEDTWRIGGGEAWGALRGRTHTHISLNKAFTTAGRVKRVKAMGAVVSISESGEADVAMPSVAPHVAGAGLRIDRRGVWSYGGEPFTRKEMVCLLASCLRRAEDGGYEVTLPCDPNPLPVDVEDVPFLAVEVFLYGTGEAQVLSFRTNVDRIVTLDADHPLFLSGDPETGEAVPYLVLSEGISARLSRPVYYELAALGEVRQHEGKDVIGLWSSRQFFVLGAIG
ncbi:MAG: DUF1285 domain-containing protein [Rhodospirillaceae bacterium]|nr:DUF1285 domain-containing protein [Rhodospirillaceae bacterium]